MKVRLRSNVLNEKQFSEEFLKILGDVASGISLSRSTINVAYHSRSRKLRSAALEILKGRQPSRVLISLYSNTNSETIGSIVRFLAHALEVNTLLGPVSTAELVRSMGENKRLRMEREVIYKALAFRAFLLVGVLGGVSALLSALSPIFGLVSVGNAFYSTIPQPDSWIRPTAFAISLVSSAYIGLFFQPRRFFLYPMVCAISFLLSAGMTSAVFRFPS